MFTRGKARAGSVKADILPALYGLDRQKPLPARFDLAIKMPSTPIQRTLDAMPDALLGELVGTQLDGSVSMDFNLEVPVYDASEMVWKGEPVFKDVTIIAMPEPVDVRKMTEQFSHTILDEKVLYER
ncbi:MAG: hypothetical protein AAGA03_12515, partial [Planctomycetota bacterium]